jgi:hypothetical protein
MRNPRSPQDPVWLARAVEDTDALLEDHAHCERKAAATAMALVARHPELPDLVAAMVELAREELEHFEEVHRQIVSRGRVLGQDPGDPYAQALVGHSEADRVSENSCRASRPPQRPPRPSSTTARYPRYLSGRGRPMRLAGAADPPRPIFSLTL